MNLGLDTLMLLVFMDGIFWVPNLRETRDMGKWYVGDVWILGTRDRLIGYQLCHGDTAKNTGY